MTLVELIEAMDKANYSPQQQRDLIGLYNQRCRNFWEGRVMSKATPELIAAFRKEVYEPTVRYVQ